MKSKKNKNNKNNKIHKFTKKKCNFEYKQVTPQTLLNLFDKNNVAIVNTLDENICINKNPFNLKSCYGKSFVDNSCSKLDSYELIVLYCANYTCSASHHYADKLRNKCKSLSDKIVLYEGGIYEWGLLSFLFPDTFLFMNKKNNNKLNINEIKSQMLNMKHRDESIKDTQFQDLILQSQQNKNFYNNLLNNLQLSNNKLVNNVNTKNSMSNKVCVVTGGTSGLGLEVVKKLLDYGAKHVTLTYFNDKQRANNVKKMLGENYDSKRFYVLRADARTIQGNKLTFDRKLRKEKLNLDVGPINCVDINAGIFGPANMNKKHIHNIKEEDYYKTIETNLNGYFLSMKYFTKQALDNDVSDGSIVCIKSIYGSGGSLFSNTAYQTSKHGVMGLVRQSAIELSRKNDNLKIKYPIRVNAVSPTFTDTALTQPFLDKNKINDTISKSNPFEGRLAYKNDIAEAVLFLLSDKSRSITGIDLPVDCGVLAEAIPNYEFVKELNNSGIEELSCCGDDL